MPVVGNEEDRKKYLRDRGCPEPFLETAMDPPGKGVKSNELIAREHIGQTLGRSRGCTVGRTEAWKKARGEFLKEYVYNNGDTIEFALDALGQLVRHGRVTLQPTEDGAEPLTIEVRTTREWQDANTAFLDRALGKPTTHVEQTTTNISAILEIKSEAQTIRMIEERHDGTVDTTQHEGQSATQLSAE